MVVLAVCLWTIATWTLANTGRLDRYGTPKAVDFAQFYVYGNLVANGNGTAMFDRAAWSSRLEEAWGGPGPTYVPLYPPTIGLVFAPFGYLSLAQAATAWTAASLILVAGGILLLVRAYPHVASDPFTVALLVAGWPALQQLLLVGQASALWFVCVVAAWQALRIGRPVLAGVALGLLGLKPSFLPFAIVVIAATGQWRALGGMLLSLTGQFAIVRVVFGPGLWTSYAGLVAEVIANPQRYEPTLWQAHGLLNALVLLLGRGWLSLGVYVVVSAGIAVWTIRGWRASPSPGVDTLSWSLFVLGLLITSAHLYVYDLVIMAAALLPILEWCLARPGARNVAAVARLAGASYVLPLFGPLVASVTHVQLSVVAFLGLFVVLARVCEARTLEPLNL